MRSFVSVYSICKISLFARYFTVFFFQNLFSLLFSSLLSSSYDISDNGFMYPIFSSIHHTCPLCLLILYRSLCGFDNILKLATLKLWLCYLIFLLLLLYVTWTSIYCVVESKKFYDALSMIKEGDENPSQQDSIGKKYSGSVCPTYPSPFIK